MISKELEARILRLHYAEGWPPGTIADQLRLHHSVVERVIAEEGVPKPARVRPLLVDPYLPFILETLEKYPRLTAVRLYQMVRERGYSGKPGHFRSIIARYRPRRPAEAYLRLKTLPGDQAQVDWGHFGKIQIGQAKRPLVAFVMVLSYSRTIFLRFFPGQHLSYFLTGHQEAFHRWQGVPRICLYDNLKSVVLERIDDTIRFNPQLLDFSARYRYEPRPVAPYRGNEKGRVERAIRYIRGSFIPARSFSSLEDINEQADRWCANVAMERAWTEDPSRTVRDAFVEDQQALRSLPDTDFPCHERKEVRVGKTPYVRFDRNDYSVPHTLTRKTLVVLADLDLVRVLDGDQIVATHPRSFDARRQIEDPAHIQALREVKAQAHKGAGLNSLSERLPAAEKLLCRLIERGHPARGRHVRQLEELLRAYPAAEVDAAIREVLERGACQVQDVRLVLERNRETLGLDAAYPLALPDDPRLRGIRVRPPALDAYDQLGRSTKRDSDSSDPEDDEETTACPV